MSGGFDTRSLGRAHLILAARDSQTSSIVRNGSYLLIHVWIARAHCACRAGCLDPATRASMSPAPYRLEGETAYPSSPYVKIRRFSFLPLFIAVALELMPAVSSFR